MKKLHRLATRLYPRQWRDRYGEELDALIEDARPGLVGTLDLLKGAITMQFRTVMHTFKPIAYTAVAGLLAALAIGVITPSRYQASATVRYLLLGGDNSHQAGVTVFRMKEALRERPELPALIRKYDLYPSRETPRDRLNALIADISWKGILSLDSESLSTFPVGSEFTYAYSYSDPVIAEQVLETISPLVLEIANERLRRDVGPELPPPAEIIARPSLRPGYFTPNLPKMALLGLAYGAAAGLLLVVLISAFRRLFPRTQTNLATI